MATNFGIISAITVGERISVARKLCNLSQAELSERLSVSAQAVGKWERGESMPDIIAFARLAESLGTDVNYFVGTGEIDKSAHASELSENGETQSPTSEDGEITPPFAQGRNMSRANWEGADFSGLHGLSERFSDSNINKCRFIGSELSGLIMKGNNVVGCDFTRSNMSGCKFSGSNIANGNFSGANLENCRISSSNVSGGNFSGADLTGAHFKSFQLKKAALDGAVLHGTCFEMGTLSELTFSGALTDCSFENCGFRKVRFVGTELRNCFFKNARLKRVTFVDCRADRLTCAFLKVCKADISGVTIIEE